MKKLINWLIPALLAGAAAILPDYASPDAIEATFATLAGITGVVIMATQAIKKLIKYGENSWKHLPRVIALVIGILLANLGWFLEAGMFAGQTAAYWQVIATGAIAAGAATELYDLTFGGILMQLIGMQKREKK